MSLLCNLDPCGLKFFARYPVICCDEDILCQNYWSLTRKTVIIQQVESKRQHLLIVQKMYIVQASDKRE